MQLPVQLRGGTDISDLAKRPTQLSDQEHGAENIPTKISIQKPLPIYLSVCSTRRMKNGALMDGEFYLIEVCWPASS